MVFLCEEYFHIWVTFASGIDYAMQWFRHIFDEEVDMGEAYVLFVGSCNRPTPYFASAHGPGLSLFDFDADTLETSPIAEYRDIDNPTFLSVSHDGSMLYANSEVFGWREGLVTAFAFDTLSRTLEYVNTQPTLGSIVAQNIVSRDGRHLLLVNYGIGTGGPDQSLVVYPLTDEKALLSPAVSVRQSGSGPNAARQERSHAHSVTEIADNLFVVADLGCDTLTCYRLADNSELVRLSETKCVAGSGPRHTALHPDGQFLFVMNELNSTCASFAIDQASGGLDPINVVNALPDAEGADNHCADIQISPDGHFLYGSNRGHDSISVYRLSEENGAISLASTISCAGRTPRNLAITPSGRHLFCANQDSNRINIFERNATDGSLIDSGKFIETGTPTCIKITNV
jgi:6-phosphogluconolactonase